MYDINNNLHNDIINIINIQSITNKKIALRNLTYENYSYEYTKKLIYEYSHIYTKYNHLFNDLSNLLKDDMIENIILNPQNYFDYYKNIIIDIEKDFKILHNNI